MQAIPESAIRAMQDTVHVLGKTVTFYEAGSATGRNVRARVVYLSAAELANAIEAYPLRVTLDARDFATRPPTKGDTFVIDDARRAVMQVTEHHFGEILVKYICGCAG